MKARTVILASASPRRAELLKQIVPHFQIISTNTAEVHDEQVTAWEMAQVNAYRKARAVAKKHPDALVLGADTLVYLDSEARLFGKPRTRAEAARMLRDLQGRTHAVITGVCLLHLRRHFQKTFAEWSDVTFQPLTNRQIREYLALVNPLDKAGAYAVQEHGEMIIEAISGSFSNVVGLPVRQVRKEFTAE